MSRMDRYYNNNNTSTKRSTRNHDLYRTIYEDSAYSNIEGIADIDKNNEVDISKIKTMLKSREEYQSGRELKSFIPKETPVKYETFEREEDRIYDIRDILKEAKSNKQEEKYHNLDQTNINILKELKNRTKKDKEEDLKDMVDTITATSKLNKLSDNELGLDVLEDLKSDNTKIETKSSIKSILDEVKKKEQENTKTNTNIGLDKSFFTSSLTFSDDDFEQINELKKTKKKKNVLRIILFVIMLIMVGVIAFLVINLVK